MSELAGRGRPLRSGTKEPVNLRIASDTLLSIIDGG